MCVCVWVGVFACMHVCVCVCVRVCVCVLMHTWPFVNLEHACGWISTTWVCSLSVARPEFTITSPALAAPVACVGSAHGESPVTTTPCQALTCSLCFWPGESGLDDNCTKGAFGWRFWCFHSSLSPQVCCICAHVSPQPPHPHPPRTSCIVQAWELKKGFGRTWMGSRGQYPFNAPFCCCFHRYKIFWCPHFDSNVAGYSTESILLDRYAVHKVILKHYI